MKNNLSIFLVFLILLTVFVPLSPIVEANTNSTVANPMISAGRTNSVVLNEKGEVLYSGDYTSHYKSLTHTKMTNLEPIKGLISNPISSGVDQNEGVISTAGEIWLWGNNNWGLELNGTKLGEIPIKIPNLTNVKTASINKHLIVLKEDGTVWTLGDNSRGQLGDGTTTTRDTPAKLNGLSNIIQVVAGDNNSFALESNGTLWAWGNNENGELGDGTKTDKLLPTKINTVTDVKKVAVHLENAMVLKSDGSVWTWGRNKYGQNADGQTTPNITPRKVQSLTDIVDISLGATFGLALKNDGSVWVWGTNHPHNLELGVSAINYIDPEYPQLGIEPDTPFKQPYLSNIVSISTGWHDSMALDSEGYIWTWGSNKYGQTGDGTQSDLFDPPSTVQKVEGIKVQLNPEMIEKIGLSGFDAIGKLEQRDYLQIDSSTLFSDPIDTASGALFTNKNLLKYSGVYPFEFYLHYNSLLIKKGPMGNGWTHPFETELTKIDNQKIHIKWDSNRYTSFIETEEGLFKPEIENDNFIKLEETTSGYYLYMKDKSKYYFLTNGKLQTKFINDNHKINYKYDSNYRLTGVEQELPLNTDGTTSTFKRGFTFTYNSNGLIAGVSSLVGQTVSFSYDSENNLTSFTDANGNKTTFTYNDNSQILTGTDNDGIVYLTNEYDSSGRVIKQYDSKSNFSTLSYDETSKPGFIIATTTNREGHIKKLIHNSNYNLVEIIDELGNSTSYTYDTKGNRTSISNYEGNKTLMSYDEKSNLVSITDSLNRKTLMEYDTNNNLTKITNPNSASIIYEYNSKNELVSITDFKQNKTVFSYTNGFLTGKTNPNNSNWRYKYSNGALVEFSESGVSKLFRNDSFGRIIESEDFNKNITKFRYDANNNLIEIINPSNKYRKLTYNSANQILTDTDFKGIINKYSYDNNGNLSLFTRGQQVTKYEYDKENNLVKITSPAGNISSISYDAKGRVLEETNSEGRLIKYQYDKNGNLILNNVEGNITSFLYDSFGNLIKRTDPNGNETDYLYNSLNQLIEKNNSLGNKNIYTYDLNGNLSSISNALNNTISFKYDNLNNLIEFKDFNGNIFTYEYNERNQLIKGVDPLGNSKSFSYDSNGNLLEITDEATNKSKREYDNLNRLINTTDPMNRTTRMVYDPIGNITSLSKPSTLYGQTLTHSIYYDDYNNPTMLVNQQSGDRIAYTYDSDNNLIETIDELNRINKYKTNSLGQNISTTDPNLIESKMTYNKLGLIENYSDPNSNSTSYLYDKMGQVLKETNAVGSEITYEYDKDGNLTKIINGRKQESNFTYDLVGNLIKIVDSEGTTEYQYDKNSNLISVIEMVGTTKKTISREYDALNRLVKYTDEFGNIIRYEYTPTGYLSKLIYPNNKEVTYSYNAAGDLISVTDWNGKTTSYGYYINGLLQGSTKPDGSREYRAYNSKQLLSELTNYSVSGSKISSTTYQYDAAGNITTEGSNLYKYDKLNRIISANNRKFSYDNAGNLLSAEYTNTAVKKDFTYGLDNQISTFQSNNTSYDLDGNLLTIPLKDVTSQGEYDSKNRLNSLGNTKYFYNTENRLTSIEENGKTTRFVVNPNNSLDQILMELDSEGNPISYYVYGLGLISKEDSNGEVFYYHYDRRGSTISLTNSKGVVTDKYSYDIYGETLSKNGTTPNRFLYNGKYGVLTDNNGLYYMRTRFYNPEIKRFINRDIVQGDISNPQTFNRYSYVNGNPISYIDPFGLSREEDSFRVAPFNHFTVMDPFLLIDASMNPFVSNTNLSEVNYKSYMGYIKDYWYNRINNTTQNMVKNIFIAAITPSPIPFMAEAFTVSVGTSYGDCPECQNAIKSIGNNASQCFTAGTLVSTVNGNKKIEDIKIGDYVLSKNDKTGKQEYKKVVQLFERVVDKTFTIQIGKETITTTEEHPFWVKDTGWVLAKNLKKGDLLVTSNGNKIAIDDIIIKEETVKVYNFEVKDYHTYFVSELGIWVHNNCGPEPIQGPLRSEQDVINEMKPIGHLGGWRINKKKGDLGEEMAEIHYRNQGYLQFPSKVGSNNGFDGVFVKYDNGQIVDIVINESKAGNADLHETKHIGLQMSDTWIRANIGKMKASNDENIKKTGTLLENNFHLIRTTMNRFDRDANSTWVNNPGGFGR